MAAGKIADSNKLQVRASLTAAMRMTCCGFLLPVATNMMMIYTDNQRDGLCL